MEMFKCKYNIAEDVFSNKDFYKTMRELLKKQNHGMDFRLYPGFRPDTAIKNWLKGMNPFSQSSSGYSPKQKIIAFTFMVSWAFSSCHKGETSQKYC